MPGLKLVAELGGDGSGFQNMMQQATKSTDSFAKNTLGNLKSQLAAMFTVGAITAYTKATINLASELRDMSDNLGINVELLQRLSNAARLGGGTMEDVARFAAEVNKARGSAVQDSKGKDAKSFARLGFSADEIANLSAGDFLRKLAKRVSEGMDSQARNDFIEVGGKSAKKLIAGFSQGIDENSKIMSEDLVDQLDNIGDKFTELGNLLKVEFAPAVADAVKSLIDGFGQLKQFKAQAEAAAKKPITTEEAFSSFVSPPAMFANVIKRLFSNEAVGAVLKEAGRQEDAAAKAKAAADAAAAARAAAENAPPGFTPAAPPKVAKKQDAATDALLSVGNFLGSSGRATLQTIAEKQLRQQEIQTELLRRIADKKTVEALQSIGVPIG